MRASVFRFFHDQLPDDIHRTFYDAVEAGIKNRQREIVCPRILKFQNRDYYRILEYVYDDHPEFFSFYPLRSLVVEQDYTVLVFPFYRYSEQTQIRYETELDQAADAILQQCFSEDWQNVAEIRREKEIFDWITKNVVYDQRSIDIMEAHQNDELAKSLAWNAYGALVKRYAVCEGIACAFKLLCNYVGLPCIVVLGNASGGRHAWNIVRVHKKFYHVDCTWDLRSSISLEIPYLRYRYFNLPTKVIEVTHKPETPFLPVCGSLQYNPFRIRGLCAFSPDEVYKIAEEMGRKGQERFAIMTIGFNPEGISQEAVNRLAACVHASVEGYLDTYGFFIGFVIKRR